MEVWGGIECSINRVEDHYFDQLSYHDQYNRKDYLGKICELGVTKLRYPVLWEKNQPDTSQPIKWAVEENLTFLKNRNVGIIAGLIHHGSGPMDCTIGSTDFPEKLAIYARAVATKFPWIDHYTPINEPLTTARFCGLYGLWYPHGSDSLYFLKILLNECKASILAMQAIREVNPAAKFVLTEDLGYIHSTTPLGEQAQFENYRRWLSIDLLCAKVDTGHPLWQYMLDVGISAQELSFFTKHPTPPDILGFNYYITSERFLDEDLATYPLHTHGGNGRQHYADIEAVRTPLTQLMGLKKLIRQAWERYRLPMAITEAHLHCGREDQLRWLDYIWQSAAQLKREGIDMKAVTAWSILGSHGWDKLLTSAKGNYESGAFDISSGIARPTAVSKLITHISKGQPYRHPVMDGKGWWNAEKRLIYPKSASIVSISCPQSAPILIIGSSGTLGNAFVRKLTDRDINFIAPSSREVNLLDTQQVEQAILKYQPWAIINAAGYVDVDAAETNRSLCFSLNTEGPVLLAAFCAKQNIKLVTFSSDLVFDGRKTDGYTEQDAVNPLNNYGKSKVAAEQDVLKLDPNALIIRTSAFFGPWDKYNFVYQTLKALRKGIPLAIAGDVFISPTYVPDLASHTIDLLIDDQNGIWHLSNDGKLSWFELATEIAVRADLDPTLLTAISQKAITMIARRPAHSHLRSNKGQMMPSLSNGLDRFFLFETNPSISAVNLNTYDHL